MIPSIFTIGGLNDRINYTLDQLLQADAGESDTGEPVEMWKDRCGPVLKARKGVKENFKVRHGSSRKVRLAQPVVSEEWLVS